MTTSEPPVPPHNGAPRSPDVDTYTFTDRGPWVVRSRRAGMVGRASTSCGPPLAGRCRLLTGRRRLPDLGRLPGRDRSARGRARAVVGTRSSARATPSRAAGLSRRLRVAAEHLGPTYIKLAQIISSGEGLFPAELVEEFRKCRDQVRAEEFATVRRVVEADLGRALEDVFAELRSRTARGRVHRPGARRDASLRRGGGGEGAASDHPHAGASGPEGDVVAGPVPRRADPHRRAGQPSGAGRAVRGDDQRGAGLPPRGREHARRGRDVRVPRPTRATSSPVPTRSSSPGGCW